MASNEKGNPPASLDPKVVRKLLDLLSSDDNFRSLFQKDAHAALVQAGYSPASDSNLKSMDSEPSMQSGGSCLQLKDGATLASKEQVAAERAKLETALSGIQSFLCPAELQSN